MRPVEEATVEASCGSEKPNALFRCDWASVIPCCGSAKSGLGGEREGSWPFQVRVNTAFAGLSGDGATY